VSVARNRWAAYGRVHKDLIYDATISSSAVRVAAMLDELAGSRTDFTQADLADRLGCSVDTIRRAVQELEKGGWLIVDRRKGEHNQQMPSTYDIVHPGSKSARREESKPGSKTATREGSEPTGKSATREPGKFATEPPSKSAKDPGSKSARLKKERDDTYTRRIESGADATLQNDGLFNQPQPKESEPKTPRRAVAAPDVFPITDEMRVWARENNIRTNLQAETEQFLDHHRAKGSTFKDWRAAWRTWMRNTAKFQRSDSTTQDRINVVTDLPIRTRAL
jgi:biotin operon repressor